MTKLKKSVHSNAFTDFDSLPLLLDVKDISKLMKISKAGAYNLINTKGFPKCLVGKRVLVPKQKLIEWINDNTK